MPLPGMTVAQKKRLQIHPAGLLLVLLSFAAWVIALGGVGGATQNCVNGGYVGTGAGTGVSVICAKLYQWEWWGLWFQGCLLVALFVSAFFEAFNKGKQVFITYFTLCTMTLMMGAHNFITNSQLGNAAFKISDKQQVANNAGAAGYTILSIFNFALLIVLGFESDPNAQKVRPEEIPMTGV